VARSGTVLFISADPLTVSPKEKTALKNALAIAAAIQPEAVPLGWVQTMLPEKWSLGGGVAQFDWYPKEGVDFFNG